MSANQARLRVVVLHGAHGGPDTNWFPWLHGALEAQGLEVVRPRLPTPQGQSLTAWLDAYDRAAADFPMVSTVLVGHSLGAAFALRLVERAAKPVSGLFLAAGFIGAPRPARLRSDQCLLLRRAFRLGRHSGAQGAGLPVLGRRRRPLRAAGTLAGDSGPPWGRVGGRARRRAPERRDRLHRFPAVARRCPGASKNLMLARFYKLAI